MDILLDTYDGDLDAHHQFCWGYYDAGNYFIPEINEHPRPLSDNPYYLIGWNDRLYEIELGIDYSLNFFPHLDF